MNLKCFVYKETLNIRLQEDMTRESRGTPNVGNIGITLLLACIFLLTISLVMIKYHTLHKVQFKLHLCLQTTCSISYI